MREREVQKGRERVRIKREVQKGCEMCICVGQGIKRERT